MSARLGEDRQHRVDIGVVDGHEKVSSYRRLVPRGLGGLVPGDKLRAAIVALPSRLSKALQPLAGDGLKRSL